MAEDNPYMAKDANGNVFPVPAGSDVPGTNPYTGEALTAPLPPATGSPGVPQADNYVEENPPQDRHIRTVDPTDEQLRGMGQVRVAPVAGGERNTTKSETVKDAIPYSPELEAYHAEALQEKQRQGAQEANFQTGVADEQYDMVRARAAEEKMQLIENEQAVTAAETESQAAMAEIEMALEQQRNGWVNGKPAGNLFDGGAGTGMLLSALGVGLAGLGGPQHAANAMGMVNAGLDRAVQQQEFQVNSMFRTLKEKYGDRDQARSALKMMQIQYAQTMNDQFAAKNASPEIAINHQKMQMQLQDAFMREQDAFRSRAFGKHSTTQNSKTVQGRAGGTRDMTHRERMNRLNEDKAAMDNERSRRELTGEGDTGMADDATMAKYKVQVNDLAKRRAASDKLSHSLSLAGAERTPEGDLIPGSLEEGGAKGLGFWPSVTPDWLQNVTGNSDSVEARASIEDSLRQSAQARRGKPNRMAENESIDRDIRLWEGNTIDRLEDTVTKDTLDYNQRLKSLPQHVQNRINRDAKAAQDATLKKNPTIRGGRKLY